MTDTAVAQRHSATLTLPDLKRRANPRRGAYLSLEWSGEYLIWALSARRSFGAATTHTGLFHDERMAESEVMLGHFKRLAEEYRLNRCRVTLLLSTPSAMLRSFYVPVVPRKELAQVVRWQAERVFPFELDSQFLSWRRVRILEWAGSRKYQVQAIAVPAEKIMPVCQQIAAAHELQDVRLTALTWEELLRSRKSDDTKAGFGCVSLVRLLGTKLTVMCFNGGALEFIRENWVESISGEKAFEASLNMVTGADLATLDAQAGSADINWLTRTIVEEFDYYYGQFSQRSVQKIVLAVPARLEEAVARQLRELTGAIVEQVTAGQSADTAATAAQAPVLPLRMAFDRSRRSLSLLPRRLRWQRGEKILLRASLLLAAFAVSLGVLLSWSQARYLQILSQQKETVATSLAAISASAGHHDLLNELQAEYEWQENWARVAGQKIDVPRLLRLLSRLTPPGIVLNSLDLQTLPSDARKKGLVTLAGFVAAEVEHKELQLAEFLKTLESSRYCSNVQLRNQHVTFDDAGKRLQFAATLEVLE